MSIKIRDPKCAAAGCTNHRSEGIFVGAFCAPCHEALRSGDFSNATTAAWGKLYTDHALLRAKIDRLRLAEDVADAAGPVAAHFHSAESLIQAEQIERLHEALAKWQAAKEVK